MGHQADLAQCYNFHILTDKFAVHNILQYYFETKVDPGDAVGEQNARSH
jgi:hypothetical protein